MSCWPSIYFLFSKSVIYILVSGFIESKIYVMKLSESCPLSYYSYQKIRLC